MKKAARRRTFKLKFELVPRRLWKNNLRSEEALGKTRWNKLVRAIKEGGQTNCVICGATERLQGHEVWEYRDRPRVSIAKLLRVEIVCQKCHLLNHWGRTAQLIAEGKIERTGYLALRKHFRTVNNCGQEEFDRQREESLAIHQERSAKEWRVDWGKFKPALAEAKAAREEWAKQPPERSSYDDYFMVSPGHHMPKHCP